MIALVLFVSGLFILWVTGPMGRFLAMESVVGQFRGIIGVIVVISGVVLVLQVYLKVMNYFHQRLRLGKRVRQAINELAALSEEEQEIIRFCVERRRKSIPGRDTWDILTLVAKGLLEVDGGKSLGRTPTGCTIPEPIWRYLMNKCIGPGGEFQFPTSRKQPRDRKSVV